MSDFVVLPSRSKHAGIHVAFVAGGVMSDFVVRTTSIPVCFV